MRYVDSKNHPRTMMAAGAHLFARTVCAAAIWLAAGLDLFAQAVPVSCDFSCPYTRGGTMSKIFWFGHGHGF
jgi:hypothetical protein